MSIKKVKSIPLYDQVAQQIERIIFQGEYKKGDLLPSERELIELTDVSRVTIREALRNLADDGIIQTKKGRGSMVIIDPKEILTKGKNVEKFQMHRQNFDRSTDVRILIEPEIARQVALSATDQEVQYIGSFLAVKGETDPDRNNRLENFHRAIVKTLNNPLLLDLFDNLVELESKQQPLWIDPPGDYPLFAVRLDEDHLHIFEAIKNKNADFAYFYMKKHLFSLKDTYLRYFDFAFS